MNLASGSTPKSGSRAAIGELSQFLTSLEQRLSLLEADYTSPHRIQQIVRATVDEDVRDSRNLLQDIAHGLANIDGMLTEAMNAAAPGETASHVTEFMASVRYEVESLLSRMRYEPIGGLDQGDTVFNPRLHKALDQVPTDRQPDDRRIAKVHRRGFVNSDTGQILEYARVSVYRHNTDAAPQRGADGH